MEIVELSERDRVANRIEDDGTDCQIKNVRGVGVAPRKDLEEMSQ